MKPFRTSFPIFHFPSKALPTTVLWICMLVTSGIFTYFSFETINAPDSWETTSIILIINWLYIILILTATVVCLSSFVRFFFRWKRNSRSILQPLIFTVALTVLLACTYALGNGNPLLIPGCEGKENATFWLKLTDMWLYSLYILLVLTLISLFGGIILTYIKRIR